MPRGLEKVLRRIRALAVERNVRFTLKALRELAALGLDVTDGCGVLETLKAADFVKRLASETTGEWLYVFEPILGSIPIYLKLILRDGCVVVSFHEDEDPDEQDSR